MTTRPPAVTVLMTAYNREAYIAAAIEGVLAQTFGDFELLIVDDCSTDGTVDVAQAYVSDSRVKVIRNPANLGDYPNRNHGLGLVRGTFVKFQDSDDVIYPHALATMHGYLVGAPEAAFALSGIWLSGPCPMLLTPRMSYEREFLGLGLFHGGPSNALFRTEALKSLQGFPLMGVGSDYVFWVSACARVSILLIPGDLQWYRIHAGQELQSSRAAADYNAARNFAWRMLNSPECPLTESAVRVARANFVFTIVRQAYWDFRAGHFKTAARRLLQSGIPAPEWPSLLRHRPRDPLAGTPLDAAGEPMMPDWNAVNAKIQ